MIPFNLGTLPDDFPPETRAKDEARAAPVHRLGTTFICDVPDGAKLITVDDRIMLVAPSMQPCWVTLTGLEPIETHPAK